MKRERITNLLLLMIVILLGLYLYILVEQKGWVELKINKAVEREIASIKNPAPTPTKDGYTPIKNIDYFDGQDGKNVTDEQVKQAVGTYLKENPPKVVHGQDGSNATDEQVAASVETYLEKNPISVKDGLTPIIQCNVLKNRWEIKYRLEDAWQLLNNQKIKCTTETEWPTVD